MNQLILGDNLEIMKGMESESIDLIYLDPPFFSNRNYEVIWGDKGEIRSFEDRWSGGIDHYIAWLKERVEEMHRLLKPTGSIYLHCDWHADAYIRVQILDRIFGENNIINHIIWKRTNNPKGSQFEKRQYGIATDSIFLYSKTPRYYFNEKAVRDKLSADEILKKYPYSDEIGRYYQGPILRSESMGDRPNLCYEYKGYIPGTYGWRMTKDKLIELDEKGNLGWSSNKKPYRKLRPEDDNGNPMYNLWDNIERLYAGSKEAIGYPTQKPIKLLERIILASSNEGDVVMDPFVGGGTTVVAADKLKRQWIGIDQSVQAVKVTEMRLENLQGKAVGQVADLFAAPYSVQLHKYDYDTLRYKNAFEFEKWIVQQYGGITNKVQRGDMGMDGKTRDGKPIQVKRSDGIGRNVVDNFLSACKRYDSNLFNKNVQERSSVGTIIAFTFGRGAVQEVARLKNEENVIIDLVKVEDIVPISKKPKIMLTLNDLGADAKGCREIEFKAVGESDNGIEFYAWDWNYSEKFEAKVYRDMAGVQTNKFKPGHHSIAVKTIDNEGLEAIETIRIKVNGVVVQE